MSDNNFADSMTDALRPGNILMKLLCFLVFAFLTATPYLIMNLDAVWEKAQSYSTGAIVVSYLKALVVSSWTGIGLGLSTVWDTMLHASAMVDSMRVGTIIFSVIILVFATFTMFQPLRLLFNALDQQQGNAHSKTFVAIVSLLLTALVASPLASAIMGGETITTKVVDDVEADEVLVNDSVVNTTGDFATDAVATIDFIGDL